MERLQVKCPNDNGIVVGFKRLKQGLVYLKLVSNLPRSQGLHHYAQFYGGLQAH